MAFLYRWNGWIDQEQEIVEHLATKDCGDIDDEKYAIRHCFNFYPEKQNACATDACYLLKCLTSNVDPNKQILLKGLQPLSSILWFNLMPIIRTAAGLRGLGPGSKRRPDYT
eukprot:1157032-Pelagomonas_calceolata.AAC.3